ncbi:RP-L13 [Mytilus coruscus]|uniref:RP-L13 n=1 Tax=Mytilus coruscus TaxID=42192 RepID=A0A6J8CW51_MYTCO|nr:RP-L13 [Mytilus coruscus]
MAYNRVLQWSVMTRTWWLYDAENQCAFRSAKKIVNYLQGKHKPIYHPLSDIGDHVVVINTKLVAMRDDRWRKFTYPHHTGYAGGFSRASAWRLHDMDPTKVMHKAVYQRIKGNLLRPNIMRRLHLFPDDNVPDEIMANISDQIQQIQIVPKRLEDYSQLEKENFPQIFEWPEKEMMPKKKQPEVLQTEET